VDPGVVPAYREVLAIYRRLGLISLVNENLIDMAAATLNTDPPGAAAILKEAEENFTSLEEPLSETFLSARSWCSWRMGDLLQARRSINELKAKLGPEVYRTWLDWALLEGLLLTEEDRLGEARAAFERNAQNLKRQGRDDFALANQGTACQVSCLEGSVKVGLSCIDEVKSLAESSKSPVPLANLSLRRARTECLLVSMRVDDARASLKDDWGGLLPPPAPANLQIARARLEAAEGRDTAALALLRQALTLATEKHWALQRLEAELRIGEIELRTQRSRGRARLTALQTEATHMGFLRIARLAREAAPGVPAKPR